MKLMSLIFVLFLSTGAFATQEVQISIEHPPTVLFSGRALFHRDGPRVYEAYIAAPWSSIAFETLNNTRERLVIAQITALTTNSKDSNTSSASLFRSFSPGVELGILHPLYDTNCNGYVDEEELRNREHHQCAISENDLLTGRTYLYELLGNQPEKELDFYRDAKFKVKMKFEGWFENENGPTKNFMQEVEFDLN